MKNINVSLIVKRVFFSVFVFSLVGCVSAANSVLVSTAKKAQLSNYVLLSGGYELPIYADPSIVVRLNDKRSLDEYKQIKQLHVYIEGDGRPWVYGNKISKNPTTRNPLALKLMLKDKKPSVYLSRPCYGLADMPSYCTHDKWTDGRYSEEVVHTLNGALNAIKNRLNVNEFVLIGHSGGGSLATLLTHRRDDVAKLVTVAGNVDHRSWTQSQGYLPLDTSLNPVDVLVLIQDVEQWHFIGAKDEVLPLTVLHFAYGITDVMSFESKALGVQKYSKKNITVMTYPDFGHHCCWENEWEKVLQLIQ